MIELDACFPNKMKKSQLYSIYLRHTDFGITPSAFEEELRYIQQTECMNDQIINDAQKQKVCAWLKDVDGKTIVANLNLQNPYVRIEILPDSFKQIATATLRTKKAQKNKIKSVSELFHVFTPHKAINEPLKFVGRSEQVRKAISAIAGDGKLITIIGERSTGKTSFLKLLDAFFQGNKDILKFYNYDNSRVFPESFIPIRIDAASQKCNGDIFLKKIYEAASTNTDKLDKSTDEIKVKLPWFEMKSSKTYNSIEVSPLEAVLQVIKSYHDQGVSFAIMVDEFDSFENPQEISSIIRQLCEYGTITCFCGSRKSMKSFIGGHFSVARHIVPIDLGPLSEKDFKEIFYLINLIAGDFIEFDDCAIDSIFYKSGGLPYFAQLFGYMTIKHLIDCEDSIDSLAAKIKANGKRTIYSDTIEKLSNCIKTECSQYEDIFLDMCSFLEIDEETMIKFLQLKLSALEDPISKCIEAINKAKEDDEFISKYLKIERDRLHITDPVFRQYLNISRDILTS